MVIENPYKKKLSLQEWRVRARKTIATYPASYTMKYLVDDVSVGLYGNKVHAIISAYYDSDFIVVIDSKEEFSSIAGNLIQKFKKSSRFIDELLRWSEARKNLLVDYLEKNLSEKVIANLTNEQIAKRYLEYVDLYVAYHLKNTPAWWVGAIATEKEVLEHMKKKGIKDAESVLSELVQPLEFKSENFEEETSLMKIAIKMQKRKIKKIKSLDGLPAEFKTELKKHTKLFSSIPFGYKNNIIWDAPHFIEKINELLAANPVKVRQSKSESIKQKIATRDILLKKLKLPKDVQSLVITLRKLSFLQELKKTAQTRSHPLLQLVVKREIAKRLGVEKEYMDCFSEQEVVQSLKDKRVPDALLQELPKRLNGCSVHIIEAAGYKWLYDDDALEFIRINGLAPEHGDIQEIKGFTASTGYARGIARVCTTAAESRNLQEGEILVTAMTTPDFVLAMKKAAAILTDEGGITCHAAIISRELQKPCIIGTKIATKVLRTGDLVEVYANKGLIRIIKRA
jgi:phosphoenolpyruvate synthase/pyruvate phosphate dikinase